MKLQEGQPYVKSETKYERVELSLDCEAFARDLAKELGGTMHHVGEPGTVGWTHVVADGVEILVYARGYGATVDKLELSIAFPKEWHALRNYSGTPKLPSISVSSGRPMKQLAADVRRRLIEPAKAPLAEGAAKLAEFAGVRGNLAQEAAQMGRRYPSLDIKIEENATVAVLWNKGGEYFNGRLYADGTVSIDRVGSLKGARRDGVLDALLKDDATPKLLAALKGVLQHCVTANGFPAKNKGRTEEQQQAFDAARAAIAEAESA